MTPYEYAKGYADNGFCVIPIKTDGSKKPVGTFKQYQTVKPTEDEMRQWWDRSNPPGLAILHGSISGFSEMLEAESLEDLEEFKQRLESHGLSYILEKLTLRVASPGGGIHFIYRCPELGSLERTPGNERLASRYLLDDSGNPIPNRNKAGEITKGYRQKPKLETRAQGGYAIVPGSPLEVHPSRNPYSLEYGFFEAVPEITKDEREILFTMARECDAIEKEPKREKTSTSTVYSEHQGEKKPPHPYSLQATVEMVLELLEDMGATSIKEGERYLIARPGKELKEGHSGTVGAFGGNGFHVFSTSWGEFEAKKTYSPFSVYAIAKHGGDFKAAAKDLGLQGYGFNPGWEIDKDFTTKQKPQSEIAFEYPEKPIPDLTTQNQTDAGNAERLIALHKGNILYSHRVGWMVWNEKYWIQQDTDNLQIAKLFLDAMRETARQSYDLFSKIREDASKEDREAEHKRITKLASFALNSENAQKITNGIKVAKSLPGVSVDPSKFEPKPWVVPFQNGVWDRGEWKEGHSRERYIERLLPVDYEPEADRTEWNALLARITNGDKELEVTLGELAATVLVAAPLRKIIIFYGEPGTGKSTLAEMLLTVLGECGVTIQSASLVEQKDDSRLGGIIRGKRGLFIAEAGKRPFDTELLKNLSGGDPIPCRLLYQNEGITIRSTWNIVMTSNDAPRIDSYDQGLRERLVAVPFLNRLDAGKHLTFTGHKRIEDARKDTTSLLIKGFAAWLVEGMNRLYLRPLHDAHLAPLVSEHTKKLIRDADPLTEFWEWYENEHEGALETGVSGLHKVYVAWCGDQGIRPVSTKTFSKGAKSYGLTLKRTGSSRYWIKEMTSNDANDVKTQILESNARESYIEKLSKNGVMASLRHLDSSNEDEDEVEEGLFKVQGEEL
jgi:P4 family phage/plasmid primase-like protien